jgi:hypothetical protein
MPMERKVLSAEVKSVDNENLTIEHFISTETQDRQGDVMVASGMYTRGQPAVLKQHGFDPDTGGEPIAKPVDIRLGKNADGISGIVVKTKYYDGSNLTPPDNTGRRLFEKAAQGFMPYWSIGYRVDVSEPMTSGGRKVTKWELLEYSQVNVPANWEAATVMTKQIPDNMPLDPKAVVRLPTVSLVEKLPEISLELVKAIMQEVLSSQIVEIVSMKAVAELVTPSIASNAIQTIFYGMMDVLYSSDGSEKYAKQVVKETAELLLPHAITFAATCRTRAEEKAAYEAILTRKDCENEEPDPVVPPDPEIPKEEPNTEEPAPVAEQAPTEPAPVTPEVTPPSAEEGPPEKRVVLRLRKEPTVPGTLIADVVKSIPTMVREEIRSSLRELTGKLD